MKKIVQCSILLLGTGTLIGTAPLTDPILREIDGLSGLFDKTKIENTLWLIKEIKNIHNGFIKVSAQGLPDPSRSSTSLQLSFKGQPQTIRSLIELEKKVQSFSPAEKAEFEALFKTVKIYFGKINTIMLADAQGAQEFMIKLIHEFCRNRNRTDSLLLNWKKGSSEAELYNHSIVSFRVLNILSTDLMNFLADLIKSCPKALKSYNDSLKQRDLKS